MNYYFTINSSCPKEYPILIKEKNECIKNNINNIINDTLIIFEENLTNDEIYTIVIEKINMINMI